MENGICPLNMGASHSKQESLQYQDIAKNLTNGWFAQNLKNGFNIYEHIPLIKYFTFKKQVIK